MAQCTDANLGFLRERPEIIKELPSFVETQAISSLNAAELFKAPIAYLLNLKALAIISCLTNFDHTQTGEFHTKDVQARKKKFF